MAKSLKTLKNMPFLTQICRKVYENHTVRVCGLRPYCSATNNVKFVQKICNATNFSYICNVNNN